MSPGYQIIRKGVKKGLSVDRPFGVAKAGISQYPSALGSQSEMAGT